MSVETDAVKTVAGLMALAARTAPKAVGLDSIIIQIVSNEEQERIAEKMVEIGKNRNGFLQDQWGTSEK